MIESVLIANRGEIACRIAATCRRLGIRTVAVFSDADAGALHVRACDVSVHLPGTAAADTYLRADLLIDAARRAGADAVHPGYGFLAESADFARAVIDAGLTWIGPPPGAIAAMGSKIEAKAMMRAAGVPVLPDSSVEGADDIAAVGFPMLVKASAGGGGRGMRIVRAPADLDQAKADAQREAAAAFGDGTVFCERYVERGRHVEIQVFADTVGHTVSLHERECSIQRRHQKIVEESPSPAVDHTLRRRMADAAVAAARAVGYVGAGTVEFLLGPAGQFWFLEMNTRLQVEHPVTELVTGLDLVELQLTVAEGAPLPAAALAAPLEGHAIEVRLTAEDPAAGYRPATGTFRCFEVPGAVRVDTGVESGSTVSPYYDSMVAKVIAVGATREIAVRKLVDALGRARLHGPVTNRDQLLNILRHPAFQSGDLHTGFLDEHPSTSPIAGELPLAAAAVALAEQAANRAAAVVLRQLPSGWRNNPAVDVALDLVHDEVPVRVAYRLGRTGRIVVDDEPLDVTVVSTAPDEVVFEVAGVRHRYGVGRDDDRRFVDADDGHATFTVLPRHPDPTATIAAGSLVAPMPGNVLRVLVAPGDDVAAGRPLVVIEAMKMEHQVVAPADGTVEAVHVDPGDQVETGQLLLRMENA
ncbi:MAG: biotin carboxylase N-terminal domain-containing protein [Ilumatobacteraceae bacterium]